ncbi:MAG: hypothetical protein BAJALOKI3v1_1110007 [Promethearchaeota archaeon]|nr:MAG: hypothetical protein BAJALOKI3v1_1110007 [Candidatus Lokiarchaeota archaeon]
MRFKMTEHNTSKFCKTCILPEGFIDLTLDPSGECDFCKDPSYENVNYSKKVIPHALREEKLKDWKNTIRELQGHSSEDYDCLLGYSGGKDSTALLDMLLNELGLSPFLLTIDTGLMADVAKENIKKTLKKLDYEGHHLFINYAIPTFLKLYSYLFRHHNSEKVLLTKRICDCCSDLLHSIMVKESMKRNIRLIILGYSSDQIKRYFYEIPQEEILNEWMPEFLSEEFFDDEDRASYLKEEQFNHRIIPRIILPYHVLPYNEEKIINSVVEKALIEKGKTNPVLTNCHTVKAAIMFDYYKYGWISYSLQYAELVRQVKDEKERKKARKKWLRLCKSLARGIESGRFNRQGLSLFLKKTSLSKKDIFQHSQEGF